MTSENNERVQPLPTSDYNASGKVKTIRPRIMKKLMWYEFKAHFKWLIPLIATLFALSAIAFVKILIDEESVQRGDMLSTFITVLVVVTAFCPLIVSFFRIREMLGRKGYLILSTPVNLEEHLIARHLSSFICFLLSFLACTLSYICIYKLAPVDKDFMYIDLFEVLTMFMRYRESSVLLNVENFIVFLIEELAIITFLGACACYLKKFNNKLLRNSVLVVIAFLFVFLQMCSIIVYFFNIEWRIGGLGEQASMLLGTTIEGILALAIMIGCYAYEIKHTKRKLNL